MGSLGTVFAEVPLPSGVPLHKGKVDQERQGPGCEAWLGENPKRLHEGGDTVSIALKAEGRSSHSKNHHNDNNGRHFLSTYSVPGNLLRAFRLLTHLTLRITLE